MRMVLTAISLLAIGLGGWLLIKGWTTGPREAAIAHLMAITPPKSDTRVELDGCHLRLDITANGEEGMVDRINLSADLRLFNTEEIRIGKPGEGIATYLAPRAGISDAYLAEGLRLVQVAPKNLSGNGETLTRFGPDGGKTTESRINGSAADIDIEMLREKLDAPNARLVFGLASAMSERREDGSWEEPKPHENAPAFHDFVERVTALDPPGTYLATRRYIGASAGDRLLTGSVRLPSHIEFRFREEAAVKSFARALHLHRLEACPEP